MATNGMWSLLEDPLLVGARTELQIRLIMDRPQMQTDVFSQSTWTVIETTRTCLGS